MKITSDEVDILRYNSIFFTKILYHRAHKTDCRDSLTPVPYCVLTFMITNRLYVQSMITFSVHEVVFIDTWRLNADVCTVNAPDHTREAVLGEEGLFDHSFPVFIGPNNEHMLATY